MDNAIEAMEQIKDRFWRFGYNMTGEDIGVFVGLTAHKDSVIYAKVGW